MKKKVGGNMYCRSCGNQLGEQDSFCSRCGESVSVKDGDFSKIRQNEQGTEMDNEDDINLEELFVVKNYSYYFEKWNKLEDKTIKVSWNWASFLLGPLWFGYRKMYTPVLIFAVFYFLFDLFFYLIDYQFLEENYYFDPLQNILLLPISIFIGIFGNYLYLKHTKKSIDKVDFLLSYSPKQKETLLKSKGGTSWLSVLLTIVILFTSGILSAFLLPTNVDRILTIKDGSFYDYPMTTVGDGFTNFFRDPNWEYIRSDSPFDMVRFTGIAERSGSSVKVAIDFIIENESFEIHSAKVDGEDISSDEINSLIDVIFSTE